MQLANACTQSQMYAAATVMICPQCSQDQLLFSTIPTYMPAMQSKIAQQGLQLRNFAVSTSGACRARPLCCCPCSLSPVLHAVCCPSRVNFLTGQYTHNNNITGNSSPSGGYMKYAQGGLGKVSLPVWMQSIGCASCCMAGLCTL